MNAKWMDPVASCFCLLMLIAIRWQWGFEFAVLVGIGAVYGKASLACRELKDAREAWWAKDAQEAREELRRAQE